VQEETGLTCSVGVAGTKFMAKLASGHAKPDGMLVIPPADTVAYLRPLPVGALWGVGASTQASLERMGMRTVADLADAPYAVLQRAVGDATANRLHELANGRDPRRVITVSREKSIGHENTFSVDVDDADTLRRELLRLSGRVGERLRKHGMVGRTIAIKVRFSDFRTITRSRTLAEPTNVGRRLFEEAWDVFEALGLDLRSTPIRLIGVRAEQLADAGGDALALWDDVAARVGFTGGPRNHLLVYVSSRSAHVCPSYGLAAYADALGDAWNDTTVVVLSEFGRTFRENGDRGTDHGHGTVHWVLGGKIAGGKIAGEQMAVTQANLFQNRDYPILNDYRDVLGGMFARLWGLNANQLQTVFPQAKARDLRLV